MNYGDRKFFITDLNNSANMVQFFFSTASKNITSVGEVCPHWTSSIVVDNYYLLL